MKVAFEKAIDSRGWIEQDIDDGQGLAALLREFADTAEARKTDLFLFTGAIFSDPETKLQTEIREIHALILDFDGCSKPWQDVSGIFHSFEHIVYSSWSNGIKGSGERFRIVIPFAEPLINTSKMTAANQYHHLWDYLTVGNFDEDAVYNLDRSKRSAQSWFYVPANTDHNIWYYHSAPTMDPNLVIREPASIVLAKVRNDAVSKQAAQAMAKFKARPTSLTQSEIDIRADKALTKWADSADGNDNFYRYAHSLNGHGIPKDQIAQLMTQNAHLFGTNTNDRLKDISRIMKSIN